MLAFIAAAVLVSSAVEDPAAASAGSRVADPDRARALAALPSSDEDIRRALFAMVQKDPERVVCSIRTQTGTRQPRTSCATLKNWFAHRTPREIQAKEAPWQLVEEIKEQRKKAMMRAGRSG